MDTPVLPVTALDSIHAAVNRISPSGRLMGAEQRISPREAIKAYTVYASLFCMGEHDRGRIEPGRLADFVLLSDDLEAIDPLTINQVKVRMTLCGGRIVYQAEPLRRHPQSIRKAAPAHTSNGLCTRVGECPCLQLFLTVKKK